MALLTQVNNPVLWQENTHQDRGMKRWRKRWWWIGYLIVIMLIGFVASSLQDLRYGTRETAMLVIWVIHATAAIFAIVAGANVISREHVGATWDALVLTGVSARQIMWGKYKAALRRAAGWLLLLGITRLAMIPIYIYALMNRFAWYFNYNSYGNSRYYDSDYQVEIELLAGAAILCVVGTVVLTVLEIMACAALGVAASALTKRGGLAIIMAITVRFIPVAVFAGFTFYEYRDSPYRGWRWWRYTPFSFADAGSSALYQLSLPVINWTRGRHAEALPGLFMASGMLVFLLAASLLVAWYCIRRSGALPASQLKKELQAEPS
jgi:ABC-type transport system involved in multi-copper enzyme maturation permease subunit